MALLDGLPRSATVKVCESKAILFYINRTDFNLFLIKNPEVSIKLVETVSRRLRDTNMRMKEIIDENEKIKMGGQGQPGPGDGFFKEEYLCPHCDWLIQTLKVKGELAEVLRSDDDFCPHYKDINPLYYEVVVCPVCGYAFTDSLYRKTDSQEKEAIRNKINGMGKTPNYTGRRSLQQAIDAYRRACYIHGDREISNFDRAELYLRLAWLYRYKKDRENEKKFLDSALQKFKTSFEEEGEYANPQKDVYIMYMIGLTYLNMGIPGEAQKWLYALTRHDMKDQVTQLAEKAGCLYQEIKQKEKNLS